MGLTYDDTPSEEWMAAKVYAEYAVRLVNDFIRQHGTLEIPMPIARSFGRNLQRAVERLPEESTEGVEFLLARDGFEAAVAPLLDKTQLSNGQLVGTLPVAKLEYALAATQDLFAHAYAYTTYEARLDMLSVSNETCETGFVGAWDSETYDSPEEDPDAEITPWDEAKQQIYDENHERGREFWKTNETQIFAQLYFGGPCAGHGGGSAGTKDRSIGTECELLEQPLTTSRP